MKRIFFFFILYFALTIMLTAGGKKDKTSENQEKGSDSLDLSDSLLVDSQWLLENREEPGLVILDTGRSLAQYKEGHIFQAVHIDIRDYTRDIRGVSGMMENPKQIGALLDSAGVSNHSPVVIYDDGTSLWASRLAWILAYLGHENWVVLDGGYKQWENEGQEITQEIFTPVRGSFVPEVNSRLLVVGSQIVESLDDPDFALVDARGMGEYIGTDIRAARGGHIPGAHSVEWTQNLNADRIFLPGEELLELYTAKGLSPDQQVVSYCQSGVRGANTWLALRLAGFENAALYDGSWADWGNNEDYPVERGRP